MNIGFIGSGKVATAFGLYLLDKNHKIAGYYSRHHSSAVSAGKILGTEAYQTLEGLLAVSDWIGITTPDDQIERVVAELLPLCTQLPSKVFFHMSGSKSSECLYPLKSFGHQCLSLHPLQSIADPILGKVLLESCYFSVEGDTNKGIEAFLNQISSRMIRIATASKPLYHGAACVASNYLYTLADEAVQMMALAGFDPREALTALLPLMKGTLENLENQMPETALTGPIARGDSVTVEDHLEALRNHEALKRVYSQMGLATLQLASRQGLKDLGKIQILRTLLSKEEELKS